MNTTTFIKTISLSTLMASGALAAGVAKPTLGNQLTATCECKNAADCTCKKGECKCKNCGNGRSTKLKVFESLKGARETTRLPDTARHDARGGVFI